MLDPIRDALGDQSEVLSKGSGWGQSLVEVTVGVSQF